MNRLDQTRAVLCSNWHGFTHIINTQTETERKKSRYTEVTMYRCDECDELHDWEDDAEECCAKDVAKTSETEPNCPVCNSEYSDHRQASDCCLWKDIDAPTRWAMADAVDAGSTWAVELQKLIATRLHQ
jgi:ssDNA-binding Zn-finger/Zn-ribbon topoisomerase 1